MEVYEPPQTIEEIQLSMRDILDRLLANSYEINENGQVQKYSGKELICKRLFSKAVKGDLRAIQSIQEIIGEKPIMQIEQYNIEVPQIIYNINADKS